MSFKDILGKFRRKSESLPPQVPNIIKLHISVIELGSNRQSYKTLIIRNSYTCLRDDELVQGLLRNFMIRNNYPRDEMDKFQFHPGFHYDCSGVQQHIVVRAEEPSETELLLYYE